MPANGFRKQVYEVVAAIPRGKVMTYGQIAALCGSPRAARIVGGIAHSGDQSLPWQRVVHKDGSLAVGYPGGVEGHRQVIAVEGVLVDKQYRIKNLKKYLWNPN